MKIVLKDNYARETISDQLIAENVNEYFGMKIVRLLNDAEGEPTPDYYDLVKDDYKLWDANSLY